MRAARIGLVAASLLLVSSASADWPEGGFPVCTVPAPACCPAAVADGSGGVFVLWVDDRPDSVGIYAHHLLASGDAAPGWGADGTRIAFRANFTARSDGQGGILVAMASGTRLFLARRGGGGEIPAGWEQPVEIQTTTPAPTAVHGYDLAADGSGGAYFSYYFTGCQQVFPDVPPQCYGHIGMAHVTPLGMADWRTGFQSSINDYGYYRVATLLAGASGSVLALVPGIPGPGFQGFADLIRMTPQGQEIWRTTVTNQYYGVDVALAPDEAGGAIVFGFHNAANPQAWGATRILANGERAWGAAVMSAATALQLRGAVTDGTGGAFAAWIEQGSPAALRMKRIAANGSIPPGWPQDGVVVTNAASSTALASEFGDGAYAVWSDGEDLFAQRVSATGGLDPNCGPGGLRVGSGPGAEVGPSAIPDPAGGIYVAWADRASTGAYRVLADQVECDEVTSVAVSRFAAVLDDGAVELVWRLAGAEASACSIERSASPEGPWEAVLAPIVRRGEEHVLRDAAPASNAARWYRLVTEQEGRRLVLAGPLGIRAPGEASLDLSIAPNPTRSSFRVAFRLADPGTVRIDLLDLAGRIVGRVAQGRFGAGAHEVRWNGGEAMAPLPAGLYFVRLRAGSATLLRRVVVAP